MREATAFRGQPVLLLLALLCGWGALRAAFWQNPFAPVQGPGWLGAEAEAAPLEARVRVAAHRPEAAAPLQAMRQVPVPALPAPPDLAAMAAVDAVAGMDEPVAEPPPQVPPSTVIAGANLLFAAGLSQIPLPPALLAQLRVAAARPFPAGAAHRFPSGPPARRWSADGWLLLRPDAAGPLRPGAPAYGRSQAGAVLRYRLGDRAGRRPQAHLRASAALSGAAERELAAGLSARPLAGLPLRMAAEARVTDRENAADIRPAAFAVTEIAPIALPLAARAEIYLQAGYVGGDLATAFADGQLRLDRPVLRLGGAEMAAGLGAWGGAQKGASRLDAGPGASVSFGLGEVTARLAADYRVRVAGDARPASGPAVTLSAGF